MESFETGKAAEATLSRRGLLAGAAVIVVTGPIFARRAFARVVAGSLPWQPNLSYPPPMALPGAWLFFTAAEAVAMEAIADRLIPTDELGAGGKSAGCAVFIDRQLSGPYGTNDGLYMQGPFPADPLPTQGLQSPLTPRQHYRQGLAALATYCRATFANRDFAALADADKDRVLAGMEKGEIALPGVNAKALFEALLANTMEGYFADPIYGGNKDMVGWKLVGFAGTRYDYRDVMQNPNKPYTLPPVSLRGRAADKGASQ